MQISVPKQIDFKEVAKEQRSVSDLHLNVSQLRQEVSEKEQLFRNNIEQLKKRRDVLF